MIASIAADSMLTVPGMATGFSGAPRLPLDDASRGQRAAQAAAGARVAASLLHTEIGFVAYVEGDRVDLAGLHGGDHLDRDDLARQLSALLQPTPPQLANTAQLITQPDVWKFVGGPFKHPGCSS